MGTRLHSSERGAAPTVRPAPFAAVVMVVALALGGTAAVVVLHRQSNGNRAAGGSTTARSSARGTADRVVPLRLVSTSPTAGAAGVAFSPTVTVHLSSALASSSPLPSISPAIPGSWSSTSPGTLVFQPSAQFPPYTTVHVTIPGGKNGLRTAEGATLASTVRSTFTVQGGSELRLQQLLAELGYLPLTFVPAPGSGTAAGGSPAGATGATGTTGATGAAGTTGTSATTMSLSSSTPALDDEPTDPAAVPLDPLPGKLVWRWANTPPLLQAQWSAGTENLVTRGAVMAFEAQRGLTVDGDAGPVVWQALLDAVAARHVDTAPYDYISVTEHLPEVLYIWQDGETVLSFPANTGIPVEPTVKGTFAVFARYLVTTMTGKNPNGSVYHDPGIPHVAYFNGGDAIHGFIRAAYGFPQSLGCVELTYADAAVVWQYDQLGTLVSIY